MNSTNRRLLPIAAALALMLALTACATAAPVQTASPAATPSAAAATTAAATASADATPSGTAATNPGEKTFTAAELAKYDGQNGNPAYVAVNGVVYDVSNVPQWKNGTHQGYKAGTDLTQSIGKSPHGTSVLQGLPIVGKYVG